MYNNQKGLPRHKNADIVTKTKLAFPEHATQSGICSNCLKCGLCEIGQKAKTGRTSFPDPFGTAQFGAEKRMPGIDEIQILPELYGDGIFFNEVKTEKKLGGFLVKAPITVAAMGSTKVANTNGNELAAGAAKAGIVYVLGENIIATYGKEGVKERIGSFLKNYDGQHGAIIIQGNGHDIANKIFEAAKEFGAHGIEIKLGQGAKQNLGGEIVFESKADAEKYKKLGYHIVQKADGTFERHAFPGNISAKELRATVEKYKMLGLKIWVKIGMGKGIVQLVKDLMEIKKSTGAIEALTIDGFGGGTGMSPWLIMNETSLPSGSVMREIVELKPNFDIILAGGYNSGMDVAKALMLGANGVSMGRPFLIAANSNKMEGVSNYVAAMKEELRMATAVLHKKDASEIIGMRDNLVAISAETAALFSLKQRIV